MAFLPSILSKPWDGFLYAAVWGLKTKTHLHRFFGRKVAELPVDVLPLCALSLWPLIDCLVALQGHGDHPTAAIALPLRLSLSRGCPSAGQTDIGSLFTGLGIGCAVGVSHLQQSRVEVTMKPGLHQVCANGRGEHYVSAPH